MRALRAEGHSLRHLLECSGLRRSTYYYALAHPRRPTRPELRDAAAEIFSRTANGCGHRQIAMCLRAELGAVVADKTVLKMMREMGIRCGIRRRGSRRRYSSYRGLVGSTFENVIARDFGAEGPWQKLGTDVCVPSSKNRQIRLSNFDTLMLTASGRAGAVAAGPPAA